MEIVNAKISGTMLGLEDHNIMTCWLFLDYGRAGQGFGGYFLEHYGLDMIEKILEVVGVRQWEDLKGKYVRVEYTHNKVVRIGNLIEDKWYKPEK